MAIVRAVKTGNWSDTTVWNTGALPTSSDDVYSNTFTVTIDTSPTVLSISNAATTGVTAGGQFVPTNGITLTCTGSGVVASFSNNCFSSSLIAGQSCTLVANATGGGASGSTGVGHTGAGTVNVIGNVSAGTTANANGALNTSTTGIINITGNVLGGLVSNCYGVNNSNSGTINITGNVTGGTGGPGAINSATGTLSVTGAVTAGSNSSASTGAVNNSTGILTVTGSIQSSTVALGLIASSLTGTVILTGPFLTTANGINPVYAVRWFWQNTTPPATYYQIRSANLAVIRPLYTADSVGGNPAVGNVRSGTVYGPANELTGTCAVPGAASVVVGVPVDNTTGTAAVTAATIRAAVGLASANLDTQLAAIPTTAAPTAAAIRTEMDANSTKLANLDATVSSRSTYAGADTSGTTTLLSRLTSTRATGLDNLDATVSSRSTYAGGDTSGTTTLLGRLTSGRASGLDNLDAAVSSRLAPGGTLARVTLTDTTTTVTNSSQVDNAAIADAVRTELTPELARVANAATTQEVGDIVEEAMQP